MFSLCDGNKARYLWYGSYAVGYTLTLLSPFIGDLNGETNGDNGDRSQSTVKSISLKVKQYIKK